MTAIIRVGNRSFTSDVLPCYGRKYVVRKWNSTAEQKDLQPPAKEWTLQFDDNMECVYEDDSDLIAALVDLGQWWKESQPELAEV